MKRRKDRTTVVVDAYTRFCLTAIAVLLTVLIIALWAAGHAEQGAQTAWGQTRTMGKGVLPNAGDQRKAILKAIEGTHDRLDRILAFLKSGDLQVKIAQPAPAEVKPDAKKPDTK